MLKFLLFVASAFYVSTSFGAGLSDRIDRIFAEFSRARPGASVLVMQDGRVLHQKSYGLAVLRGKKTAGSDTNYRLASVSKTFTAIAVLSLRDRGLLSLDQTLRDFFPDFPSYGKNVTVRHLLSHTSGLREYFKVDDFGPRKVLTDRDVLALMKRQSSGIFAPGKGFKYTNSNYALLAEIVAQVSKKPFARFVREELFTKGGMASSAVFEIGTKVSNKAIGYIGSRSAYSEAESPRYSHVLGDGGIYSSTQDLASWSRALERGSIVSTKTLEEASRPTRFSGGSANYGLGWRLDSFGGFRRVYHTGTSQGFKNIFLRIPSRKITIVILSNFRGNHPLELANRVQRSLLAGALD